MEYPGPRPNYSFVYYRQRVYKVLPKGESLEGLFVAKPSGHVSLDQFLLDCGDASLAERHVVLAIGSNGCPGRLAEKFGKQRGVAIPVLCGTIKDVGVVYSRQLTSYGALPATFIRKQGALSHLSVTLLSSEQLNLMDVSEQVGRKYERIPIDSDFLVDNNSNLKSVTAYLDRKILSYGGHPIFLKMFKNEGPGHMAMNEREVLSLVFDQAKVMLGHNIEERHQQLISDRLIRQQLTQYLESHMADLQVNERGVPD